MTTKRKYVAGVDSSTQSCKVVIVDPNTQTVVRSGKAPHPNGTEIDPEHWWQAFQEAVAQAGGLDDVAVLSVGGQQHGMVCLDAKGEVIRPALLWNDTRSAKAAQQLIFEAGSGDFLSGKAWWAEQTGTVPVASITVTKLRWLADNEPENVSKIAAICLPHDWLTWKISGSKQLADLCTDRSDASGTGYFDRYEKKYHRDIIANALRISPDKAAEIILPRVLEPWESVLHAADEFGGKALRLGPGCGDNAGAALGVGLEPGVALLSLGTSGVVCAVSSESIADYSGSIAGFADATGKWLPLACTLNASRIIDAMANIIGADYQEFDELALSVADAGGLRLLPYFEGERTPNLPDAKAELVGMDLANCNRPQVARATIEGLLRLMRGALDAVRALGVPIEKVLLVGGGAKSKAVQKLASTFLAADIEIPDAGEYVALGAAHQAINIWKETEKNL